MKLVIAIPRMAYQTGGRSSTVISVFSGVKHITTVSGLSNVSASTVKKTISAKPSVATSAIVLDNAITHLSTGPGPCVSKM